MRKDSLFSGSPWVSLTWCRTAPCFWMHRRRKNGPGTRPTSRNHIQKWFAHGRESQTTWCAFKYTEKWMLETIFQETCTENASSNIITNGIAVPWAIQNFPQCTVSNPWQNQSKPDFLRRDPTPGSQSCLTASPQTTQCLELFIQQTWLPRQHLWHSQMFT